MFIRIVMIWNWWISAVILRAKNKQCLKNVQPIAPIQKGAIIATHADDEAIGAWGVLKNCKGKLDVIYMRQYGENHSLSNRGVRDAEITEMCSQLGAPLKYYNDICRDEWNQYDCIFLPCPFDWHDEHIDSIQKVLMLIGDEQQIYLYEETILIPTRLITNIQQMNKQETRMKWKEISSIYISQKNLPWTRFRLLEYSHGLAGRHYSAEVFCLVKKQDISEMLQYRAKHYLSFSDLKKCINQPLYTQKDVNRIYDEYANS